MKEISVWYYLKLFYVPLCISMTLRKYCLLLLHSYDGFWFQIKFSSWQLHPHVLRTCLTGFLCCYRCSMEIPFFSNQWWYFLQENSSSPMLVSSAEIKEISAEAASKPANNTLQSTVSIKLPSAIQSQDTSEDLTVSLPFKLLSLVGVKGGVFSVQWKVKVSLKTLSPRSWFWALKPLHRIKCLKKWPNGFLKCRASRDQHYSKSLFYQF